MKYFLSSLILICPYLHAQDISLSVGTTVPYQHYAGVSLETKRMDISYRAGILIPPYPDLLLGAMEGFGVADIYIDLLDASFQFGFTNSLGVNYKMGKKKNWYLGADLRVDRLTASDTPTDLIEVVTGETLRMGNAGNRGIQAKMGLTLYAAGLQFGRNFNLGLDGKHKIRTGLVMAKHIASRSSLAFGEGAWKL